MGRIADKQLFNLIHDYFTLYLPNYKSASEHTLRSYRKALDELLEFIKQKYGISLFEVSFEKINRDLLQEFMTYLREEKKCKDSTCNLRLTCIRAFLKYCAESDAALTKYYLSTDGVAVRTVSENNLIDYLSEKAVRAIVAQPDIETDMGQRDMFFMILLYDTGARVDEMLHARICDVKTESPATMLLFGKGKKYRKVPLSAKTVSHYKKYLKKFHPGEDAYSQEYIFYTIHDGEHHKMSDNNVRTFMRRYGREAQRLCPEIPDNVHPHLFRHSRAMHLYQGGMDLTLVSQWLGHANLQTTLIYAHADTEQKRKAIELAEHSDSPTKKNPSPGRYTIDDEETLKRLYGLL